MVNRKKYREHKSEVLFSIFKNKIFYLHLIQLGVAAPIGNAVNITEQNECNYSVASVTFLATRAHIFKRRFFSSLDKNIKILVSNIHKVNNPFI